MTVFSYQAIDQSGKSVQGTLSARDRGSALNQLSERGLQAFDVRVDSNPPKDTATTIDRPKSSRENLSSVLKKPRLTGKQLVIFTEELSDLLSSGVQLDPALQLMEKRADLAVIGKISEAVRKKIRDGSSFSRALAQTSPSFNDLYCNLVAAGEASGSLPVLLKRQVQYLLKVQELRSKVLTSLIYPTFLFFAGGAVTILFITFLIPRLTMLIESTENEIPGLVSFVLNVTQFGKNYWWLILGGILTLVFAFRFFVSMPGNRPWWDRTKLRIPLFGKTLRSRFHVHFLQTLGNLLDNGLSLVESFRLTRGITSNVHLRNSLDRISENLIDGGSLHRAMAKSDIFPPSLIDLVRISEETGKLANGIQRAGERFDRELEKQIERMSAFIQPIIILAMAAVVGVMAYLMITVIYDTISILRSR